MSEKEAASVGFVTDWVVFLIIEIIVSAALLLLRSESSTSSSSQLSLAHKRLKWVELKVGSKNCCSRSERDAADELDDEELEIGSSCDAKSLKS